MSVVGIVLSIALPLGLVMLGGVIYNRREQAKQVAKNQARMMRQKAGDILEALEQLVLVDDNRDLQQVILDRVSGIYMRAQKTGGVSELGAFDPQPYKEKISSNPPCRKVFKSDKELKVVRRHFSTILKTLAPLAKQKMITEAVMLDYRRHLKMVLMEREVDTYSALGDVAAERTDVVTASSYYKAARKVLIEFDVPFSEKNERIRAISEKTAALYSDGEELAEPTDALSKALSLEESGKTNEFGMSTDPEAEKKRY